MRHVRLQPGAPVDSVALTRLIATAYADMQRRLESPPVPGNRGGDSDLNWE